MNTGKKFDPTADRIEFNGVQYILRIEPYQVGNAIALCLHDETTGMREIVATVNMPHVPLGPNQVLIKDYGENTGMLAALEKAGVVARTGRTVKAGFVSVEVCELLPIVGLPLEEKTKK